MREIEINTLDELIKEIRGDKEYLKTEVYAHVHMKVGDYQSEQEDGEEILGELFVEGKYKLSLYREYLICVDSRSNDFSNLEYNFCLYHLFEIMSEVMEKRGILLNRLLTYTQ